MNIAIGMESANIVWWEKVAVSLSPTSIIATLLLLLFLRHSHHSSVLFGLVKSFFLNLLRGDSDALITLDWWCSKAMIHHLVVYLSSILSSPFAIPSTKSQRSRNGGSPLVSAASQPALFCVPKAADFSHNWRAKSAASNQAIMLNTYQVCKICSHPRSSKTTKERFHARRSLWAKTPL